MTQAQIHSIIRLLTRMMRTHPRAALFFLVVFLFVAGLEYYHSISPPHRIARLIDPARLAPLGDRAANPSVQKYVAILEEARLAGKDPAIVAAEALALAGIHGRLAALTQEAMLRNRDIAERLGCLTPAGLQAMREGRAPLVGKGPYQGDVLSVDHIIPRSLFPEYDKVIANLELMPLRLNMKKNRSMGARQDDLLRKLREAGL